jgi:dienelactone hydrolase
LKASLRPLEVILFLVALIGIWRARWWRLGALPIFAAQIALEGYRWQLLPTYFIVLAALLPFKPPHRLSITARVLATGVVGVSALFSLLLPVFQLPAPSGKYPVGTAIYHWVDNKRIDPFVPQSNVPREVMTQVWYPGTSSQNANFAPYVADAQIVMPQLARVLGLPAFVLGHFNLIETHAQSGIPLSSVQDSYPLLIFSPGRAGIRWQDTGLMENLASHGYMVAAVDHPYSSAITVFPDGRSIVIDPSMWPTLDDANYRQIMAERTQWLATDVSFVLDQILSSDLGSKIDPGRIGVIGHSLGGAVAIEVCAQDARFKVGINLDGTIYDSATTLTQPLLLISREQTSFEHELAHVPPDRAQQIIRDEYDGMQSIIDHSPDALWVTVAGAYHYNFTDLPFWSPLTSSLGLTGTLSADRGSEILTGLISPFLDDTFGGKPLTVPNYSEVTIVNR